MAKKRIKKKKIKKIARKRIVKIVKKAKKKRSVRVVFKKHSPVRIVSKKRSAGSGIKKIEEEIIQIPPEEEIHKTKIRVIGIGGGAVSIISEISSDIKRTDFYAADIDAKSLNEVSKKAKKFQFGQSITKGLGTGMNDQIGEQAALSEKEKIKKIIEGQDLCIFVSCLGGGTGSGAGPVFTKIAKSAENMLTYGIFTLPFEFEGEKKMQMALRALEKIKPCLNAYSVIPNERIFQIIDKNTPLNSALSAINKRLADNLEGLIEMIYMPGLINIDFADLTTVLSGRGKLSYLNTIEMDSLVKEDSVNKLISSSLYPFTIKGAKAILYNIRGANSLKLSEVSYISRIIAQSINKNAKIIFGITQNKSFQNRINIVLLAVGCNGKFLPKKQSRLINIVMPVIKKAKKQHKKPQNNKISRKAEQENKEDLLSKDIEVKIRRNGMELKKVQEELEKEIQGQEKVWDTPAIFRNNKDNEKYAP